MRQLTNVELSRIKKLTENYIELTLLEPTAIGLEKSIMDATGPVRIFLKERGIHDYDQQKQGPEHKVILKASIINYHNVVTSQASLYRPQTKAGDPRIWFKGLNTNVKANDILGIIPYEKSLYVINLTKLDVESLIDSLHPNPLKDFALQFKTESTAIAEELLYKLRKIAAIGPIPADIDADTAVGRTLERVLELKINSSKKPDYKGIELKSFRDERDNRKTLFAQVSNWKLSKFKSSAEILNAFGYERDGAFKLYCTVSSLKRNSQGLMLKVDKHKGWIVETSALSHIGDFAIWTLETLHARLLEKHNETFWVAANSRYINNREHFIFSHVEHTKKPITSQFDILIEQGVITMDHLIKRTNDGKVIEKGPLFKIKPAALSLLFPPSQTYNLLS